MVEIVIRVGSATEIVNEDRLADVKDLASEVAATGNLVQLEVVEYVPGQRGLTYVELVFIYIGIKAGDALISSLTNELFETAKAWAHRRAERKSKEPADRPIGFVIYGPDGKVLRQWDTRDDGGDE